MGVSSDDFGGGWVRFREVKAPVPACASARNIGFAAPERMNGGDANEAFPPIRRAFARDGLTDISDSPVEKDAEADRFVLFPETSPPHPMQLRTGRPSTVFSA
jgi:hypothetical protein